MAIIRKKKERSGKKLQIKRKSAMNAGHIFFFVLLIYFAWHAFAYITRPHVRFYEVNMGEMVTDTSYRGMILRDEQVEYTEATGYINYYIREGRHTKVGGRIYSLDDAGSLQELIESEKLADIEVKEENIYNIKRSLSNFISDYNDSQLSDMYDVKYNIVSELADNNLVGSLERLDTLLAEKGITYRWVTSPVLGDVSFVIDGYEGKGVQDIHMSDFETIPETRTLKSGELVEVQSPAYKVITSQNWSVVFPLTEEEYNEYATSTTLNVKFIAKNLKVRGNYSSYIDSEGNYFGRLDFSKYVARFSTDRFVDFEIEKSNIKGLKIPSSSVFEKSFYLVPMDYMIYSDNGINKGFYKEVYTENGTEVEFVSPEIYSSNENYYYIAISDTSPLTIGDYIRKPDSDERFQIGETGVLLGVYSINKGYTIFKQIDILSSNEEYYIISTNQKYGLSVYDHILIDPKSYDEGDFIYN